MFNYFNRFKQPIKVLNKPDLNEKAVLTRTGKSASSNFKSNFVYTCLLQENTRLENGDIIRAKTKLSREYHNYLIVSVRRADESVQATAYQCNGDAEIWRPTEVWDSNDDLVGSELTKVAEVPTNHVTVNSNMRLLDAGLLPSTTKEFRMPKCDIRLMDRIVLEGRNYCVDSVDTTKFDGLLAVQTSNDNRSL